MREAPDKQVGVAEARAMAYRYLGAREHSCQELRDKLQRRGVPSDVAFITVDELAEEGLVSDHRYTESFIRSRVQRHQGPLKIRAELRKRGVADALIDDALSVHEADWSELALAWAGRRVRGALDRNEKARLYRSGTSRGFTHEQMMRVIDTLAAEH